MRLRLEDDQEVSVNCCSMKMKLETRGLEIWLSGQEGALLGREERMTRCGHDILVDESWSHVAAVAAVAAVVVGERH